MRFPARGGAFLYVVVLYAFLLLPVAVLAAHSFSQPGGGIPTYLALGRDPNMLHAVAGSTVIALASSLIAVLLAGPAAYALARHQPLHAPAMRRGLLAPLATGYLTVGIGLLVLSVAAGWPLGLWTVGAAHLVMALPVCFIVFSLAIDDRHIACERAARDLGASEQEVLRQVTLPMLAPAAVAGFLLAVLVSWVELPAAFLVAGPSRTMPLLMFDRAESGGSSVAALALVTIVLALIPATALVRMLFARDTA